jgi:hypothetical protein
MNSSNRFVEHHSDAIDFGYSCFDRIICHGFIPQFQHEARIGTIVWFLRQQRHIEKFSRACFSRIAGDYHSWLCKYAANANIPIVEPDSTRREDSRREDFVEPYFRDLGNREGIAVILKAREPERIVSHFVKTNNIELTRRWVNLYNFYINDANCGRLFIRICPYFPFHIRFWMNGHNWLACQLQREGIAFHKRDNTFVACANPKRLQELADSFAPQHIRAAIEPWLQRLLPFFTEEERQIYRHQFFMSQMEYCHNLVFHKKEYAHRLLDRLMDANRFIGHPDKLAHVFGRQRFQPDTATGQTVIRMTKRHTPVISSGFKGTSVKQYVDHLFRTESSVYQLKDLKIRKNIDNLPRLREVLNQANERYLTVQQDVLSSYIDAGQLKELRQPTISASGRRTPGLHIDDPRLMALCEAVACFVHLAGHGTFRTKDLLPKMQKALDNPNYKLSQLRYDLSKLRGKGLVKRVEGSQDYQLTPEGYRLIAVYLKLYHRCYAPLTAGVLEPAPADNLFFNHRQTKLDRLYQAVDKAVQKLTEHLGLAAA